MQKSDRFTLHDNVLEPHQDALIRHFIEHLGRKLQQPIPVERFYMRRIGTGLSSSVKIVTDSDTTHPYFLKISKDAAIMKESGNHNRASVKLPPLNIPPIETAVVASSIPRLRDTDAAGYGLIAYRYLSADVKGSRPSSFFEFFGSADAYKISRIIDDIFQVALFDLHNFAASDILRPFEHFRHDESLFSSLKDDVRRTVANYNAVAIKAITMDLPHGIVHGDLHAENIIVNRLNHPIIIDFEMLRLGGCLVSDYAELEVSILMTALDLDVNLLAPVARRCYSRRHILDVFGTDKLSRAIQTVRQNLMNSLFVVGTYNRIDQNLVDRLSAVYRIMIMRYICSYIWVASRSMEERRSLVVIGVMLEIFDMLHRAATEADGRVRRRAPRT